jgi:formamidopyrimidine-DNA glycosylase
MSINVEAAAVIGLFRIHARIRMPELPEVETVRRGLAPVLEGRRLATVEQRRADLRFPFPEGFVQRLTGATVLAVERRAKYLRLPLDRGDTLVCHLGMSGRFEIGHAAGAADRPGGFHQTVGDNPKHEHAVFTTGEGTRIAYFDPRRFGFMGLISTPEIDDHPWFAGVGPEPLDDQASNGAVLQAALAGRRQNIKVTLLDQRVVAGIGNIYACEALFAARISPERPAGSLTRPEANRLADAVKAVLAEAIEAGGSTLRDFSAADGALGYFQHRFKVYDREGQGCSGPRGGTVLRQVQGGRSTFYCPACQT